MTKYEKISFTGGLKVIGDICLGREGVEGWHRRIHYRDIRDRSFWVYCEVKLKKSSVFKYTRVLIDCLSELSFITMSELNQLLQQKILLGERVVLSA